MTDLEETLGDLASNRQALADEIDNEEWGNARVTQRWLSDTLDDLKEHIEATEDATRHNELVDEYNAALEQWNDAAAKIMAGLERQR